MKSGIYLITSRTHPDRQYVGSSVNIPKRWRNHRNDLKHQRHSNNLLQGHANKYGIKDLQFTVLQYVSPEELITAEQGYIEQIKPSFNICQTAKGSWQLSPQTKAKMSKAHKKRYKDQRERDKMSKAMKAVQAEKRNIPTQAHGFVLTEAGRGKNRSVLVECLCIYCGSKTIRTLSDAKRGYKSKTGGCCATIPQPACKDILKQRGALPQTQETSDKRIASHSNRSNNASGYTGVVRTNNGKKWRAWIKYKGKRHEVARVNCPTLAAIMRDKRVIREGWPHRTHIISK